jgi:hypothetical protein
MKRFLKFIWILSAVGFATTLLMSYRTISEVIYWDLLQNDYLQFDKNWFFYGFLTIFFMAAGIFHLLFTLIPALPPKWLFVPLRSFWLSDKYHYKGLVSILQSWVYALAASVNTILIAAVFMIEAANHRDGASAISFGYMIKIAAVLFALSVISMPIRLFLKRLDFTDRT